MIEFEIPSLSETDLAWAAGLIDGEGCIHIARHRPNTKLGGTAYGYQLVLAVSMVHKPTLDRLASLFQCGVVQPKGTKSVRARQAWNWRMRCGYAAVIIRAVRPYLFTKAEEVYLALDYYDTTPTYYHLTHVRGSARRVSAETLTARATSYQALKNAKRYEWVQ